MGTGPTRSVHYPKNDAEFRAWFATEAACYDYLSWLRWPTGFVCPKCGGVGGWAIGDGRYKCASCKLRTSLTARTIFDKTRMPLTVWMTACWYFATDKDGVSALALQRRLGVVSYQTAWTMLSRLRAVLVDRTTDLLTGEVEVDETFIGGYTPGQRGGRQAGAKVLVGVAVERPPGRGFGRCRLEVIPNANTATLRKFLTRHVAVGSHVITDGWAPYIKATKGLYTHTGHVAPGTTAVVYLPAVHRSHHLSSAGCSRPIRVRSGGTTCRSIWPSSSSASTGAAQEAGGWSSTDS